MNHDSILNDISYKFIKKLWFTYKYQTISYNIDQKLNDINQYDISDVGLIFMKYIDIKNSLKMTRYSNIPTSDTIRFPPIKPVTN